MESFYEISKKSIEDLYNSLDEKAYFAKFIDAFLALSKEHKRGFLIYFLGKVSKDRWEKDFKDDTLWLNIIRGILVEYSGREKMKEPSKIDLSHLIKGYLTSTQFKNIVENKGEKKFDLIEELKAL